MSYHRSLCTGRPGNRKSLSIRGRMQEGRLVRAVGPKEIIFARCCGVTGNAALIRPFRNTTSELHSGRILVEGTVRKVFRPEPVLVVRVIAGFASEHDGYCGQMSNRIVRHLHRVHTLRTVIVLHDHPAGTSVHAQL